MTGYASRKVAKAQRELNRNGKGKEESDEGFEQE